MPNTKQSAGLFSWLKFNKIEKKGGVHSSLPSYQSYITEPGKAVWSPRAFEQLATEGYMKNVIAYRSISLIAQAAASVSWQLFFSDDSGKHNVRKHALLDLFNQPNPHCSGSELIELIVTHRMIHGNAYVLAIGPDGGAPQELHVLRPDRVKVIAGKGTMPAGYEYTVGKKTQRFAVNPITGASQILHLKNIHPLNDWYGMSAIEAAAYSIDQHNQAAIWNQALLQNGAKPSGALVVKTQPDGGGGYLTDEQYGRVKAQIDEEFSGAANAGRPLLLEGGLDWKEMSLSPKDMDFIESKNSSARDIALAFGVPPQLLGIPGDNTYSNLVEARYALWEQTILPMLEQMQNKLGGWLVAGYDQGLSLSYDTENIAALAPRRERVWKRLEEASFMTVNEKRAAIGLGPIEGGEHV